MRRHSLTPHSRSKQQGVKQMNDVSRLPKWAQAEIQRLQRDVKSAEERLAAAFGNTETRIEIDPYRKYQGDGEGRRFVPNNTTIRFLLEEHGEIDVRLRDNELILQASGRVGCFCVKPQASNVVHAGFVPE
jgi:hypothetical protein